MNHLIPQPVRFRRVLFSLCAAGALALPSAVVAEEEAGSPHSFSANVGIYSDYVFRGITNSNEDPAIQGGFDYAHDSGFYLGTWASNIEFNAGTSDSASIELNFYGGFAGSFANGIDWDIGAIYYYYPGQNEDSGGGDYDYVEVYGSLAYTWEDVQLAPSIESGLYYSPDFFGEDGDGIYVYGTFGLTLPGDFSPYVTVGYQDVDGDETSGPAGFDYVHWAIGMSKEIGIFTADLSWQDGSDLTGCSDACEAVVFSVSSSF
jgi:uncharacterized protein (TIGR02001 family)